MLTIASCSLEVTPQPQPGPGGVQLEIPEPGRVDWRRTVAGFEISGVDTEPDQAELALLERAILEMPDELLEVAQVRRFYRVPAGDSPHGTAAYAIGPDVYLIDETFRDLDSGLTTFDLVRLLAHEMTHAAQFAELEASDIDRIQEAGLDDPIPTSSFVAAFADGVGWSDRGRATGLPDWVLPAPAGTTSYGRTAPEEDMAETVAEVVTGSGPAVSADRERWVQEWLDTSAARLNGGRPWAPRGSQRIVTEQRLYDEDEVARRASGPVEVISYAVPAGAGQLAQLSRDVEREMAERQVKGTLQTVADDRVDRSAGLFTRGDGVAYWVEIWDFRNAPGFVNPPSTPVITYAVLWIG